MKKYPVKEFMTREVVTIHSDAPLSEVIALLAGNKVRSLPVTDAEGHLVGIISETDLFLKERHAPFSTQKVPTLLGRIIDEHEIDQLDKSKRIPVEQVMRREVETATEETTLEEAAMKMMRLGITNLPVVRDGLLIGVVRRIDILRVIFSNST
jgi:CBS domain-containing protein